MLSLLTNFGYFGSLLTGALVICILAVGRLVYLCHFHPLSKFPGPVPAKATDAWWYYTLLSGRGPWRNHDWHKKYGPIVRIAPNHLSFADPSAQKIIYGFGTRAVPSFAKDPGFFTPEVDGSMNVINEIDKEEHSRMRRMLSHAFSTTNLLENEDVLIRRTTQFLDGIGRTKMEEGKYGVDIVRRLNYVTFDIMGEMSFGDSFDQQLEAQPEHRYHWADVIVNTTFMNDVMRAVTVIPGLFSFLESHIPQHSKETLYRHAEYATEHTEARLRTPSNRRDFMSHILSSKGPKASVKEMASHYNVIMMAGAVTTATMLSATFYYLCHSTIATAKLQAEIRNRFQRLEDITSKSLLDCEYLNAVIEEGLRMYPPAGAAHLSRIVPEPGLEIAGKFIPAGTRVSIHPWSVVRDPSNFFQPDTFIPERWMKSKPEELCQDRLDTSLPFSYGPRGCIGKNLAYLEIRMILARMFWQYNIVWFNGDEVDWERDSKGYTLWEKPKLRIMVEERALPQDEQA